jgi:hypothetical protein
MPQTDTAEQAEPATTAPAITPAPSQTRRGRVIAAIVAVAVTGFAAVAHVTGALIPLLALGGLAAVLALTFGFRATSRLLPKRRSGSRYRLPRVARSRRTTSAKRGRFLLPHRSSRRAGARAGGSGQRRRLLSPGRRGSSRPRGLTSPRLGRGSTSRKGSGRGHAGASTAGQGRRRGLGQRLRHPFRRARSATSPQGGKRPARRGVLRKTGRAIGTGLLLPVAGPVALRRWMKRRKKARASRPAGQGEAASEVLGGKRRRRGPVRAWRARRKAVRNAQPSQAATGPDPEPEKPAEPEPEPQTRPATIRPQARVITTRKDPTVSNHIDAAAEAIDQHVGSWEPENAVDLDQFLGSLPRLFESLSGSIQHVAERLGSEFPVEPVVAQRLHEIAVSISGMADFSGEAHAVHRVAHAREMERIENPRPNERLWDVVENQ